MNDDTPSASRLFCLRGLRRCSCLCGSAAFVAKTLPCVFPVALVAKTLPLPPSPPREFEASILELAAANEFEARSVPPTLLWSVGGA